MRKSIFFTLCMFLVSYTLIYGQNQPRWQLGLSIFPNLNKAVYTGQLKDYLEDFVYSGLAFSYGGGADAAYFVNDKISIESGVRYAKIHWVNHIDGDYLKENYHSLSIPVSVSYWSNRSKVAFFANIGCSGDFLVKYNGYGSIGDKIFNATSVYYKYQEILGNPNIPTSAQKTGNFIIDPGYEVTYRKVKFSTTLSSGVRFNLTKFISFRLNSAFRYTAPSYAAGKFRALTVIYEPNSLPQINHIEYFVRQHFLTIGLNIGLYVGL